MTGNKSTFKIIFFYILTFGIVIGICFVVAEKGISYYYSGKYIWAKFDPVLGWRLAPGKYTRKPMYSYQKNKYYVNKFGLRNRDITPIKDENTKRIIMLGDSFTYGYAVKNKHLFTTQLEKLLNENTANTYEVINAGLPKYGTAQQLLLMKDLSENNVKADIYILMMFTNDILDILRLSNYIDLSIDTRQPGFVLDDNGNLILKYPPKSLQSAHTKESVKKTTIEKQLARKKGFSSVKFIKERIGILLQTKPEIIKRLINLGFDIKLPRVPSLINGWYQEYNFNSGTPIMKALLKEMSKEAHNNNADLIVVLIPSLIQVNADTYGPILKNSLPQNKAVDRWLRKPRRPQQILRQMCEDLNIVFYDLLPVMRENKNLNLYIAGDGHFSKAGHEITARSLVDLLKSKNPGKTNNTSTTNNPPKT